MTPDQMVNLLKNPAVADQISELLQDPSVARHLTQVLRDPAVTDQLLRVLQNSALMEQLQAFAQTAMVALLVPVGLGLLTLLGVLYNAVLLRRLLRRQAGPGGPAA